MNAAIINAYFHGPSSHAMSNSKNISVNFSSIFFLPRKSFSKRQFNEFTSVKHRMAINQSHRYQKLVIFLGSAFASDAQTATLTLDTV